MSSIGRALGAAGCVLLAWIQMIVMAEILPAPEFSAALFGLICAVILTWMGQSGLATQKRSPVMTVLKSGIVIGLLVTGIQTDTFSILGRNSTAGFIGVATGISLGAALCFQNPLRTISIFLCAGTAAVLGLENAGAMSAVSVLGTYLVVALCLVLFRMENRQSCTTGSGLGTSGSGVLFRIGDAILAAAILSADAATLYLTAWAFAMACACIFSMMNTTLGPHLKQVWNGRNRAEFTTIAARTNLGFLLIGGGGTMFVFVLAQGVLEQTHANASLIIPVLLWLTLSHCGPVLMGAGELLMSVTQMQTQHLLILLFWGPTSLVAIILIKPTDPTQLAMLVAGLQLGYSLNLAIVLGVSRDIWPGITAVLQRELKLT